MGSERTRRGFLGATGAAAASVALAGCSGGSSDRSSKETTETTTQSQTTSEGDRTLDVLNSTMSSFDPVAADDTASGYVTSQLYDGLLTYPDGQVPVAKKIAKGYEVSDDYTTYTFTLKQGVKFHDGQEVTAQDFVYSWERLAASKNSVMSGDILSTLGVKHETTDDGSYKPGTLAVKAVDDYTFQFELEKPFHAANQVMSNNQFAVVPEGIVGDVPGYEGELSYEKFATKSPVGAGPFEFKEWKSGQYAEVVAYDEYHGSGPHIEGVHWQVVEDDTAAFNYAMNKNLDVFTIPTANYDKSNLSIERTDDRGRRHGTYGPMRNGETVNYVGVPTLSVFYIGFNMQAVPKPVRQAVAYAMNQQLITERVFKGRGVPAYHYTIPSIYPDGADAYEQHAKEKYPYGYNESQLDEAKKVMEEAGYGPNNKYELEFLIYQSKSWMQTAKILRDQLASAHIDFKITQAPFSAMLSRVENMNVQAYSLGWIVPWASPDAFVKHLNPAKSWPSKGSPEAYNNWPLDSPSAKKGIDAWKKVKNHPAPTESDKQARQEGAVALEEANWEGMANLPVYHSIDERFWYDHVDVPAFGSGGPAKQKFEEVRFK